jgi:hypothetical protein
MQKIYYTLAPKTNYVMFVIKGKIIILLFQSIVLINLEQQFKILQ